MKSFFLLFFVFCCFFSSCFALDWEKATISRVIDTEHALLSDGRVIEFIGFDGPDHLFPSLKERGTARRTFRLLKMIFETQSVKILKDTIDSQKNVFPRHIKLENGTNLVELLLRKGLGTFRSQPPNIHFDTQFQQAESLAKEEKIGIWGKSEFEKTRELKKKIAGVMTIKWKKKYGHFLAPISTGRVAIIPQGNTIILDNGLCVRLLGIETPSPLDTRKGQHCFGQQARDFLASLVLGQKVEFTQDISQWDEHYCLLRHVWIPENPKKMRSKKHINKIMIEQGFGKVSFPEEDESFREEFFELQKNIFQTPQGAWLNCATQLFKKEEPESLKFDPNCPIKISSSGKIHTPKSGWYKRLKPVRCFETEAEAHQAGF